jgi:hypothetical protein
MRIIIAFLILGFSLVNCTEDETVTYTPDAALTPYVEKFFTEAEEHGVSLERNLISKVGQCQAVTDFKTEGDQKILIYNESAFNRHSDVQRQAHVCFILGKALLGRSYEEKAGSFMNGIPAYNPADEQAMFDELFQ